MLPTALLRRQAAFFRKGFLLDSSYRSAFVVRLVGGLLPLTFFFFLRELVNAHDPRLAAYGGDYFAFVAVGIALTQYFAAALSACVKEVRNAQMSGVLEATLSSGTSPVAVILHGAVYHFVFALSHFGVVLLSAALFFGLDLSHADWAVFAAGFAAAVASFLGLSLLAAGMIVHTKSAEPMNLLLGGLSSFLAGAYFPVSVLPDWLRTLAGFIPMTHALEVLRGALLTNAKLSELAQPLARLLVLAIISLATGTLVLSRAIAGARRRGTLGQY